MLDRPHMRERDLWFALVTQKLRNISVLQVLKSYAHMVHYLTIIIII